MSLSDDTKKELTEEQQEFWDALKKDYSREQADDIMALHGVDIEEELAAALAEEIAKELKIIE